MLVLDCGSRSTALTSVAAVYGVDETVIEEFLCAFDIDAHYAATNPDCHGDRELRRVFESLFGYEPAQLDRVVWFHLTRTSRNSNFETGIQPLSESINRVWQVVLEVFRGTEHERGLLDMQRDGVPDCHYRLKVGVPLHAGPYAVLVREAATRSSEIGNHDYLWLPEIMEDICNGYQGVHGVSLHQILSSALAPVIVKFWSTKQLGVSCLEAALYYLYVTAHGRRMTISANTCFDGENCGIPPEQIVGIEYAEC